MERKIVQIELPDLEAEILKMCLFEESYSSIKEESELSNSEHIISDAIKNLIHYKMLVPVNISNTLSWVYDSDKMRESTFKATALGILWVEDNL